MSRDKERFEANLWHGLGEPTTMSSELHLVCGHRVSVRIDEIGEDLYFRRTGDRTELWRLSSLNKVRDEWEFWTGEPSLSGPIFDAERELRLIVTDQEPPEEDAEACKELLAVRVKAGTGHEWPAGFDKRGLLDKCAYSSVIRAIKAEYEAVKRKAEEYRHYPIIQAAAELGLGPEPGTWNPNNWTANCPGTKHWIGIVAGTGEFFCGYCCAKGGVEELRAFVRKRRPA